MKPELGVVIVLPLIFILGLYIDYHEVDVIVQPRVYRNLAAALQEFGNDREAEYYLTILANWEVFYGIKVGDYYGPEIQKMHKAIALAKGHFRMKKLWETYDAKNDPLLRRGKP